MADSFVIEVDTSKYKTLPSEVELKLKIGLSNMAQDMYNDIKAGTPSGATHQLQKGIRIYPSGLNLTYYVSSGPTLYALPAFLGSKPHFPPVEPLIKWVELRSFASELGKNLFRRAFVLAVSISKRGTIGIENKIHLWENTFNKYKNKVGEYLKI